MGPTDAREGRMFWVNFLSDDLLNSYYFGSSHKRNFPRNLSFKTSSEFSAFQTTFTKVITSRIYKLRENTRNLVKSKVSLQTLKHWQPELGHRVEDNLNPSSAYWISNNSSKLNCRYDPTATRVPIDSSFIANAWLTDVGDYNFPRKLLTRNRWITPIQIYPLYHSTPFVSKYPFRYWSRGFERAVSSRTLLEGAVDWKS